MILHPPTVLLADATLTLALPDLAWTDELHWAPVGQVIRTGLTGKPILYNSPRVAGRPITLEHKDRSLMSRARFAQVQAWAAVPGQRLQLTVRGQTFTVEIRHADGGCEAVPALDYAVIDGAHPVWATLRFITVE